MAIRTRKKQSTTRLWLLVALLIVVVAVIFLLPAGQTTPAEEPTASAPQTEQSQEDEIASTTLVKEGMQAPDFTVKMFDGSELTLSKLKGKVVLVNFWATWCPPCREELTRVQSDLIDRFADRAFVFLPISRGEEQATIADFRTKMNYTFPMGLDTERTIYDQYASNYIPRNFLIDQQGKVVMATVGYEPEEFERLIAKIDEMTK